jgi:hypothetical protein
MILRMKRTGLFALVLLLTPSVNTGKVLLRWTQSALPTVKTLGVNDPVIP